MQTEGDAVRLHCRPSVLWQVSGYSLLVQAVDSGIPAMSSTATVNIDISDVNDNSPVFTPANYTAVIQVSHILPASHLSLRAQPSSSAMVYLPFL